MKRPQLPHVKFVRARNGRDWHAYFDTGKKANGKRVYNALGLWGSQGFFDRYTAMQGHRTRRQAIEAAMTVSGLIRAYERSSAYSKLAEATKRSYGVTFKRIGREFGDFPIDALERRHIRDTVEQRIDGNATRNLFVAVIGALYKYARREELTDNNPTREIESYAIGQWEPWPEALLEAGLHAEETAIRRAVAVLYYTGQRIGDACSITWPRDGIIRLVQQKTGKSVEVPIHRDLADELAKIEKRGLTILADEHGRPLDSAKLGKAITQWAKARGHKVVPHGLRKNAVNALLEAGCTIAEVASITGQTFKVVEHYSRRVNQGKLAKAAIYKLERKNIPNTA